MYSQTYFVLSKTFSRNQMPVPMGFVPCKTFSRNEIENTRSNQQAICRPEKDLHPLEYVRAGRTQKSPGDFSPGLCDPNRIQTYNLLIRSQMLYSIELWDQFRSNDLYFDSAYFVAPSSLRITIFFSLILAFFPESALR